MRKNFVSVLLLMIGFNVIAQTTARTVGTTIYNSKESSLTHTLFAAKTNTTTYLINNCGEVLHTWTSQYFPGNSVYLMEDASLFRAGEVFNRYIQAGGAGGIIEKIGWDNQIEWSFIYNNEQVRAHHDFQVLPNGNVLILAWEVKTKEEAIANGRNPDLLSTTTLWPEHIIEVEPNGTEGGNIIWEWHAWDHLVQDYDATKQNFGTIADHPEKININYIRPDKDGGDWMHANALNYNAALDQIMISIPFFHEIWIIDHNISSEEAAGEKGDLLFRWGNPRAYNMGDVDDQKLFHQHNAHWISAGLPDENQILIFNNGNGRTDGDTPFSSVIKIAPSIENEKYLKQADGTFMPSTVSWEYTENPASSFYARFLSGAQQLANGNLLVTDGAHGRFFEINSAKEKVWEYINPVTFSGIAKQGDSLIDSDGNGANIVFRSTKYPIDYPAFELNDLSSKGVLEIDTTQTNPCNAILSIPDKLSVEIFPNPVSQFLTVKGYKGTFELYDINGSIMKIGELINSQEIDLSDFKPGMYVLFLEGNTPFPILKSVN